MPESRTRSRKRKAVAAVTKACGRGNEEEEGVQSQSCATVQNGSSSREERYVPRFGSSTKKPRTAAATFSCSQPVSRVTDSTTTTSALPSSSQSINTTIKDTTHAGSDSKTAECVTSASEPEPEAGNIDNAPTTVCDLVDSITTGLAPQDDSDKNNTEKSTEVVNSFNSQVQEPLSSIVDVDDIDDTIPGMSLSQHCSQQTISLPLTTDTHVPAASNEQHHTPFTVDGGESTRLNTSLTAGSQITPSSPHTLDSHNAQSPSSQHTSLIQTNTLPGTIVDGAVSTPTSPPFREYTELSKTQSSDEMNLDLLDPLECNNDNEEEIDNELMTETVRGSESHHSNQQTPDNKEKEEVDNTTTQAHNETFKESYSSLTHSSSVVSLGEDTTSVSTSSMLHETSQMVSTSSPQNTSAAVVTESSLYDDGDKTEGVGNGKSEEAVSSKMNDDSDGVMCESGEMCEGVEDVMVVGDDSGQLSITHEPQLNKDKESMVSLVGSADDELLAVKEMMDLTANDLLESQLLEEATVPSCSPHTLPITTITTNSTAGGSSDSSQILRGLIKELSTLNQFVMACKRELDATRRQRTTWTRSQQGIRGRR